MRLTVVIPAKDEAARIGRTLRELRAGLAAIQADGGLELLVVDDGSTDGTAAVAGEAGADRVVRLPANRGKGAAVRKGVLAARGRTIAYTDADLSYPPADVRRVVAAVEAGADMAAGSRRHPDAEATVPAARLRAVSGRVFNVVTARLVLQDERDTQCGLKAFTAPAARLLFARSQVDGFAFDVELFLLAQLWGLQVVEVPVALRMSSASTVRVAADAARMARDLIRMRRRAAHRAYDLSPAERERLRRSD